MVEHPIAPSIGGDGSRRGEHHAQVRRPAILPCAIEEIAVAIEITRVMYARHFWVKSVALHISEGLTLLDSQNRRVAETVTGPSFPDPRRKRYGGVPKPMLQHEIADPRVVVAIRNSLLAVVVTIFQQPLG